MPLRDLLCALEATEEPSTVALDQALALARGYGVHVSVAVSAPEMIAPHTLFESAMVSGLVGKENACIRNRAEALARFVRDAYERAGLSGGLELHIEPFQTLRSTLQRQASCHDLVVLDRPGGALARSELLFEELLLGTGRPLLLTTPERAAIERVDTVALAWDGSSHAARAIGLALALFPEIKQAHVVMVTGEKDLSGAAPGAAIAAHIGRHDIEAKIAELAVQKDGVGATLDAFATRTGCDLIVMGGFGRSRLREFVLGGVTRQLTQTARTALLLAH